MWKVPKWYLLVPFFNFAILWAWLFGKVEFEGTKEEPP